MIASTGVELKITKKKDLFSLSPGLLVTEKTSLEAKVIGQEVALARLEEKMDRIIGQAGLLLISDAKQDERLKQVEGTQVGEVQDTFHNLSPGRRRGQADGPGVC